MQITELPSFAVLSQFEMVMALKYFNPDTEHTSSQEEELNLQNREPFLFTTD